MISPELAIIAISVVGAFTIGVVLGYVVARSANAEIDRKLEETRKQVSNYRDENDSLHDRLFKVTRQAQQAIERNARYMLGDLEGR